MVRNYNPLDNDITAYINAAIQKALKELQTCIPAIVKKVESRERVVVSPAVQQTSPEWKNISWADISLPVYTPAGGSGIFSMPVAVGDVGWIVAGDLDPSLFMKDTTKPARQNMFDRHNYQYGYFLPCKMNNFGIDSTDDGGVVIKVGSSKIVVKENEITINSNDELKVNAKTVKITSNGNKVVIDGINFKDHKHDVTAEIGEVTVNTNTGKNTAPLTWTSGGAKS